MLTDVLLNEKGIPSAPTITGTTPFTTSTNVTITAEAGATIYYTIDGTTPTTSSTQYTVPVQLSDTATVKAIAVKNGISSEVATKLFEENT